jgi:hypothetical protein
MNSPLILNDIIQKISDKTELNALRFQSSILCVYRKGNNQREKPTQVGTAFLFEHEKIQYLATARHVLQQASQDGAPLFLSKCGKLFNLNQIRDEDSCETICDKLDFHIIKLREKSININAIFCERKIKQEPYELALTIGYPNSRNKKRVDTLNKSAQLTSLKLTLSNHSPNESTISTTDDSPYFSMYREDKALDKEWNEVDSIGLRGMSGAPCFYVPFTQEDVLLPSDPYVGVQLIGLLIEMHGNTIKFIKFSGGFEMLGLSTQPTGHGVRRGKRDETPCATSANK